MRVVTYFVVRIRKPKPLTVLSSGKPSGSLRGAKRLTTKRFAAALLLCCCCVVCVICKLCSRFVVKALAVYLGVL